MSIAKFLAFPAVFAIFLAACGEVSGGFEDGYSSSNYGTNSSSSFDIGLEWIPAPDSSFVHGTTKIMLDAYDISKNLITQKQYKIVMGVNPSKKDTLPIYGVTWLEAVEFCKKLSLLMGLDSNAVRLPTEAEWEYAAIPGVIQRNLDYWEWTNDCWDARFPYEEKNPSGPPNCPASANKVCKGFNKEFEERPATNPSSKEIRGSYISFRVVLKKKSKRNF
ncbi:MAG: SUMF1/EgtB/PvdO family nonheme iron enzyme [Fibromonadaceae bacterium]|jgi:formylglycine-generating enzyme required for sulfatase activity|nr:SUMF1/EgtB/PvdO family nonheme iron enzyme [Fibromonadaceae bacterium]